MVKQPTFSRFSVSKAHKTGSAEQLVRQSAMLARRWQQLGQRGAAYYADFKCVCSHAGKGPCMRNSQPLTRLMDLFRAVQPMWAQKVLPALSKKLQPLLLTTGRLRCGRPASIVLEHPSMLLGSWGTLAPMPSFRHLPEAHPDSTEHARVRRFLTELRKLLSMTLELVNCPLAISMRHDVTVALAALERWCASSRVQQH